MKTPKRPAWNEGLKLIAYCPLCEMGYRPTQARLLVQKGETHLLHITCRKCRASVLALVLVHPSGASSIGIVTDLSFDDAVRFQNAAPVSADSVLDVHKELGESAFVEKLSTLTDKGKTAQKRRVARKTPTRHVSRVARKTPTRSSRHR